MLVLKGLVVFHRTIQLQLLQHYFWGIDLDYHDIEWFTLETNKEIILLFLRLHPSATFQTLGDDAGYSISSKGFLPTVVDNGHLT